MYSSSGQRSCVTEIKSLRNELLSTTKDAALFGVFNAPWAADAFPEEEGTDNWGADVEAPRLSAFAIGVSFDLDGVEGERAGSGETPAPDSAGVRGVRPDGGSCWRRPGEPCFCGAVPAVTAEGALSMATGESRGSPAPGRRLGTGLASAAAPTRRLRFVPAVNIFISEQHTARRLSIASIETPRASAAATDACTDAMSATADMP